MNLFGLADEPAIDPGLSSDEELARAARESSLAFLPLYERFVTRVYGYCLLRLGDKAEAEDVTSDVFLKAIGRLSTYRGGSFAAWLFAITRNTVADVYRQRAKRGLPPVEVAALEVSLLGYARREALLQAIARLSNEYRTVIELQLSGWHTSTIAAALGKSPGAIKMLRLRAIRRLRELLTAEGWIETDFWSDE